jgi:hypothetical protein
MSHDLPHDDPTLADQNPEPVYDGAFSLELGVGPLLWIYNLDDQEKWGNVIHLPDDELGLSPELSDELTRLGDWYDDSFDWTGSAGPSPWRQDECDRFNQAVIDTYRRLGDELGPRWNLHIEFSDLHEDPAHDRSPDGRAADYERHRHAGAPE